MDRRSLRADLVLVGLTAFWGITFVVVKDALGHIDALSFVALRFGLAALVATPIAGRRLLEPATLRAGLLLSVFLFLGYVLQTVGLEYTTPSRSAFFTGMAVLLVPFVGIFVFKRWPQVPSLAGVGLAVAGLYLISGGLGGGGPAFGDGLTLGCAAAYAVHITLVEKLSPGKPVLALVGVQVWGVALASAACLPFRPLRIEWTGSLVGALIFSGVFSSVVAISLQTWAQSKTSSVRAALIFSLEPVFAAGYSVALGRERLGKVELLGGVLIVLGVVIGEVGGSLWSKARA